MNARLENVRLAQVRAAESKLDESRAELWHLFADTESPGGSATRNARFPRSKTARFLMSNKGLGLLAIAASGFLIVRPRMLGRALRWVPMTSLLRMAALRMFMPRDRQ